MPLDAEAEAGVRPFQPLNEAVLAEGGDHKPRGGLVGRLMVLAVDEEGVLPDDLREQGAPAEGDGVDLGPVVVVGDVLQGLDVLIEGAAQKGIEHLNAPADAEDGLVGGEEGAEQLRLGGVPQGVGLAAGGDAGLPVEGGLDVAAAGQQQAVAFQRLGRGLVRVGQLHPADLCARAGKALNVFGLCSGELRVGAHPGHGNDNRHLNDLI